MTEEAELATLRRKIDELRRGRKRARFPSRFRREVVRAIEKSGIGPERARKILGISSSCLNRWQAEHPVAPFNKVEVIPDRPDPAIAATITIEAPQGLMIRGLTITQAATLLSALKEVSP